jgi:hypothetical protein
MCGVFYCKDHGKQTEPYSRNQAISVNSLCQSCTERYKNSQKAVSKIFLILGASLLMAGIGFSISTRLLMPGGIFVFQGVLFMAIAAYSHLRKSKSSDQFDQR